MTAPLKARICAHCGKPKGCFAFTMIKGGRIHRDYYHPDCATKAKNQ